MPGIKLDLLERLTDLEQVPIHSWRDYCPGRVDFGDVLGLVVVGEYVYRFVDFDSITVSRFTCADFGQYLEDG